MWKKQLIFPVEGVGRENPEVAEALEKSSEL